MLVTCIFTSELGKLNGLLKLHLTHLPRLCSWPSEIDNCNLLRVLVIEECPIIEMPVEVSNLSKLVRVDFIDCKQLTSLPANIDNWVLLQRLVLRGCVLLVDIPEMVGCVCLKYVNPGRCKSLVRLPSCASQWKAKVGFQLLLDGCSDKLVDLWSSL
jgi:hypothetical protein